MPGGDPVHGAAVAGGTPRVLLVRLSSLGDVVHAAPVLADIRRALPQARVDWVVEEGFAPLLRCFDGIDRVIPFALRRWKRAPLRAAAEVLAFRRLLRGVRYDAVIDLQGLVKSALVGSAAALQPGGRRHGLANRTEGSGYEPPARWTYHHAVPVPQRVHVVARTRTLVAAALGYPLEGDPVTLWRLPALEPVDALWADARAVLLAHGSAMPEKLLPAAFWVGVGRRLRQHGQRPLLPWGTADERARADAIAQQIGGDAAVMPRLPLDRLTTVMARMQGCIGLDTGVSHIASALGLATVQIYMTDQAWRVGASWEPRTVLLPAREPPPSVDEVLGAWSKVA